MDSNTVGVGQCTTLRWDVRNVQAVYVNGNGVAGQSAQQVCPGSTVAYTLTVVRNDGGQESRQVIVNVIGGQATAIPLPTPQP